MHFSLGADMAKMSSILIRVGVNEFVDVRLSNTLDKLRTLCRIPLAVEMREIIKIRFMSVVLYRFLLTALTG